jgi:hypothetical protein
MKKLYLLFTILIAGLAASAQNLQGDMENWQTYNVGFPIPNKQLEKPAGWRGADSLICTLGPFVQPGGNFGKQVFKSSDAHGGSFAARLLNRDQDTLGIFPGLLTNAKILVDLQTADFSFTGGTPVTGRIDTVKAWVKYFPKGADEGALTALAVITGAGAGGADSVVGMGSAIITGDTSYYQVEAVLTYPDNLTPNALQVTFSGSSNFGSAEDSTELFVDDVTAVGSVGINMQLFEEAVLGVYPNPAANTVYLNSTVKQPLTWELYTQTGAKVIEPVMINSKATADISTVASGVYIYQVKDKNGVTVQTGKLNVAK